MQSFRQKLLLDRKVHEQIAAEKKLFLNTGSQTYLASDASGVTEYEKSEDGIQRAEIEHLEGGSPTQEFTSTGLTCTSLSDQLAKHIPGISTKHQDGAGQSKTFIVGKDASDRSDPRAWPRARRIMATFIIFWMVFISGWASSANSSSDQKAAASFHVSPEAETLSTALFLFGVAFGSLPSGPISETFGRNPAYLISMFLYLIMVFISALAPNLPVQLVFRFLSGIFASPSMTIYGGSLADMYTDVERSLLWPIFALAPILGPVIAPIVGGWLIQSDSLTWRWVDWVTLIISGFVFLMALFFLPETFFPLLEQWKAGSFRKETGDSRFKANIEFQDSLFARLRITLTRPIFFFTREPIVIFIGFYLTLIYVLVYSFLNGFTYIFVDTYGFSQGQRGTAFAAIVVGVLLNTATLPFFRRNYIKRLKTEEERQAEACSKEVGLSPEIRLWPAIFSAPLLPISLFWLGWTNYASISPWSDLVAAGLFGFSLMGIFISSYQYVIDSYETNSASAMSSITFLRYIVAGGLVIADIPMYEGIGVHWTLTLMGCLGTVLVPVPLIFWKFGGRIRARSQFAKKSDLR